MADQATNETILAYIKRSSWTEGLSETVLAEFSEAAELVEYQENEVVHRAVDNLTKLLFVVGGRLQQSILDTLGREVLQRPMIRGSVFGLFSLARSEPTNVNLVAVEPTTVITLSYERLHQVVAKHPALQLNLFRLAGDTVRQLVMVDRKRLQPTVVAVIHQSERSRATTQQLLQRLAQIESGLCLWSDDPEQTPIAGIEFQFIFENNQFISVEQGRGLLKEGAKRRRVLIDVSAKRDLAALAATMRFADRVLWCAHPSEKDQVLAILDRLREESAVGSAEIQMVWLLDEESSLAPNDSAFAGRVGEGFKIAFPEPTVKQGRLLSPGMERIIHSLRGVRIGIALGGGAARGMAHLGVLKALQQSGIYVDVIAGTSAGAMVGTLFAHGMDADYTVESFLKELHLPWVFRHLPGGGYLYLLYKYRRHRFDPMLRRYLGNACLEQMQIPMRAVTVDLVRGAPVTRVTGDAVRAILESINLPGLSRPILRGNEALVDGGIVDCIPADVLVSEGCNFVIASSVTAKLEHEFSGIRADDSPKKRKPPSTLKSLFRAQLVQNVNMNAIGVASADFVIEPDVTQFDLSEFERADELAEAGERQACQDIPRIKQLLAELDPQLFANG